MARITAERPPPKTKEDLGPKVKAHTRYFLADGTQVPGVTSIVDVLGFNKDTLIKWARNEALAGNDPDKIWKAGPRAAAVHLYKDCRWLVNRPSWVHGFIEERVMLWDRKQYPSDRQFVVLATESLVLCGECERRLSIIAERLIEHKDIEQHIRDEHREVLD